MANPSGNQDSNGGGGGSNGNAGANGGVANGGTNPSNGNSKKGSAAVTTATENDKMDRQLRHNPGIRVNWTAEEQSLLEDGLSKYASEPRMVCYANIVRLLQDKTIRDVAIRCKWMTDKKESGKRKKEDHSLTRKNRDKKERISDPSAKSSAYFSQPNIPQHVPPMVPMDIDDGISYQAIGGATGQLLEQNAQLFNQITAHFTTLQIPENINLFNQIRENIQTITNDLNDMPGIMKQMPPLPVKVNEELANSILGILPRTTR